MHWLRMWPPLTPRALASNLATRWCHMHSCKFGHQVGIHLLAPTGALVLMMVYYISAAAGHFFRFSLSPLMQLMLQVSL